MGKNASKQKSEGEQLVAQTSGSHFIEFNMPSMGPGGPLLLVIIIAGLCIMCCRCTLPPLLRWEERRTEARASLRRRSLEARLAEVEAGREPARHVRREEAPVVRVRMDPPGAIFSRPPPQRTMVYEMLERTLPRISRVPEEGEEPLPLENM